MGIPKTKSAKRDDFDYDEIIKTTSDHQKSLDEIQASIQQIAQIVQPIINKENFALFFRETTDSQVAMNNAVAAVVKKLILENPEIKSLISAEIKKSDRDWMASFMRRIGWAIWSLFLAVAAFLAGKFL